MPDVALLEPGKKVLLLGNEAIARGAVEAGVQVATGYPGTPASEIIEALYVASRSAALRVQWSVNEKVALEVAAGASIVGARSLTAMKSAGLNVAMDTFVTLPYGGVRGGLLVAVADDPGAHYSSTEQDTRWLALAAEVPCLEPCDQEEARAMSRVAFDLSEELELPVMLRSVTRISHCSGDVTPQPISTPAGRLGFNKHYRLPFRYNVYGAPGAVHKHRWLHGRLEAARRWVEECPFNEVRWAPGASLGVVAAGVAFAYAREVLEELEEPVHFFKLGVPYPLPERQLEEFARRCQRVLVLEEGDGFVRVQLEALLARRGISCSVEGKPAPGCGGGIAEPWGELDPDLVRAAVERFLGRECDEPERPLPSGVIIPRSSTLCAGCSHLGAYWSLREAVAKVGGTVPIINGDIGCYEQGGYGLFAGDPPVSEDISARHRPKSPYDVLDTMHVMGSGVGLAQGQWLAGYPDGKLVAVCGDSTFFHAVLPSLANAALYGADVTVVVLDNRWTAMTGHQPSPTTGRDQLGERMPVVDPVPVIRALGVDKVLEADAYDLQAAETAIREALEHPGPAVVVLRSECRLQYVRRERPGPGRTAVDPAECTGCRRCVSLGCPAVGMQGRKAVIDSGACNDCGLCVQVCPAGAIREVKA